MLIGDIIQRQAERIPDKIYQVFDEDEYSFYDVNLAANRFANALLDSGLSPGDHIGIFSFNCIEYVAVFWGAAKAGLVLVHFNARLKDSELAGLARHSEIKMLLFRDDLVETVRMTRDHLKDDGHQIRYVSIGAKTYPWAEPFSDAACGGTEEPGAKKSLMIREDDPFTIMFTSGTEGFPKGVLLSHKQRITVSILHLLWVRGFSPRLLNAMPFFHQTAQGYAIVTQAMLGKPAFQFSHFNAETYLRTIEYRQITYTTLVPSVMVNALIDCPAFTGTDLSSLELILFGGEPTHPATLERMRAGFPKVRLCQTYGQTEMGSVVFLDDEGFNTRPKSVGRPSILCDVQIIGENGKQVKRGESGEVVVRSPSLMIGYYKNPEATKDFFKYGPEWGRTGDLGYLDDESYLTIVGRIKDMFKTGGENVYPVEIEKLLSRHPAVREAAVFGIPDKKWGEVGATAIVRKTGIEVTKEEILAYCKAHLANFKCPKYIKFYESLPKNALGKIVKRDIYPDFADLIE